MKNISFEQYYSSIESKIKLLTGYLEDPYISNIIHSCRLKPINIYDQKNKTKLERYWIDEFGNSLKITDKQINIIPYDTFLINKKIINTDLFANNTIKQIITKSNIFYILAGTDEDFNQPIIILNCLDSDNYLRSFIYIYNVWTKFSPLLNGINNLKLFFEYGNFNTGFLQLPFKLGEGILPNVKLSKWITLDLNQKFLKLSSELDLVNEVL